MSISVLITHVERLIWHLYLSWLYTWISTAILKTRRPNIYCRDAHLCRQLEQTCGQQQSTPNSTAARRNWRRQLHSTCRLDSQCSGDREEKRRIHMTSKVGLPFNVWGLYLSWLYILMTFMVGLASNIWHLYLSWLYTWISRLVWRSLSDVYICPDYAYLWPSWLGWHSIYDVYIHPDYTHDIKVGLAFNIWRL